MYITFVRYVLITVLLDVCSVSPEMHGAKQRAGPSVRALLSCNDLQSCIPQELCKVMISGLEQDDLCSMEFGLSVETLYCFFSHVIAT